MFITLQYFQVKTAWLQLPYMHHEHSTKTLRIACVGPTKEFPGKEYLIRDCLELQPVVKIKSEWIPR